MIFCPLPSGLRGMCPPNRLFLYFSTTRPNEYSSIPPPTHLSPTNRPRWPGRTPNGQQSLCHTSCHMPTQYPLVFQPHQVHPEHVAVAQTHPRRPPQFSEPERRLAFRYSTSSLNMTVDGVGSFVTQLRPSSPLSCSSSFSSSSSCSLH